MKYCDCSDWKPNIDLVNGSCNLAFIHGLEFTGKVFEYCPWCGKKLEEIKDESEL
jgi:hypothetical protein